MNAQQWFDPCFRTTQSNVASNNGSPLACRISNIAPSPHHGHVCVWSGSSSNTVQTRFKNSELAAQARGSLSQACAAPWHTDEGLTVPDDPAAQQWCVRGSRRQHSRRLRWSSTRPTKCNKPETKKPSPGRRMVLHDASSFYTIPQEKRKASATEGCRCIRTSRGLSNCR